MVLVQRLGYKPNIKIKRSFFVSRVLTLNSFTVPICKRVSIIFPLYEVAGTLKSKSIVIMMNFLEQISGLKAVIKQANLIVGSGLWVKGQVDLASLKLMNFFLFFNEFILADPEVRESYKLPILKEVQKNYIKLIIFDIGFFFDTYTRRSLPLSNHFWLELNFYFETKGNILDSDYSMFFYTQYFFSHNFLEWRNQQC